MGMAGFSDPWASKICKHHVLARACHLVKVASVTQVHRRVESFRPRISWRGGYSARMLESEEYSLGLL